MKGGSSFNFMKVRLMIGFDGNEPHECVFTDLSNPCKSAPSAKSAFYRRTDPRKKSTEGEVSGFIHVHPRVFYDVTLQGVEE
jgi:hypothetical protein